MTLNIKNNSKKRRRKKVTSLKVNKGEKRKCDMDRKV